ncbi:MAG: PLP-dependent aminotransferase family protein [Chloroflexi bacterium]|nr:MAG: PLP-dependent aminotransferase family protein [Chloroflexota bacterium]
MCFFARATSSWRSRPRSRTRSPRSATTARRCSRSRYGLLRYRGEDRSPLGSLAAKANVVSIGSFSKTFLPGLRVGWAIAERDVIRRMAAAKQTMDSSTGTLAQRIVMEFHRRGGANAHLSKLRALYAEKQAWARAALAREFAGTGVRWNDPEGGFYFWVTLPQGVDARQLLDVALEEGVAFVPGEAFSVAGDHRSALRFSISGPSPDRIDEGVRRLRRAFDRVVAEPEVVA